MTLNTPHWTETEWLLTGLYFETSKWKSTVAIVTTTLGVCVHLEENITYLTDMLRNEGWSGSLWAILPGLPKNNPTVAHCDFQVFLMELNICPSY